MRIRDLRIDGFGRFTNFERGPFDQPITVFHGPNEAGKSTLLEFIRRVLFGFPDGRSRLNPYPPLAGGGHGGRITILGDAGEIATVHRSQGARGGVVTLTTESGRLLPSYELPRLLGHHSREVFQRVFAFTVDELHDKALLSDESVNSQIYSAGMGAAKLPDALNRLSDEKGGLFLKGGSRHAIYDVAQNLERIDSSLREVANNASEYGRLSVRLKEVEAELRLQNERRRKYQSQLDNQQRLDGAWDNWNDLVSAEEQLITLPVIEDFPNDGVNRLEKLEERGRSTREERDSAQRDVDDSQDDANTKIENEVILDRSTEIRGLQRRRDYFDSAVRDRPKVEMELSSFRNELTGTLEDLGHDWDESRLESFDLSIAVRQEVSQHQEHLRRNTGELERKNVALDQAQQALKEAADAENDAEQKFNAAPEPSLDDEQIRLRRNLIRAGLSQLNQVRSARQRAGDLKTQLDGLVIPSPPIRQTNNNKIVAAVSVGVAVALFVGGAVFGGLALAVAIIAGLLAIGFAAYLFATNPSATGADAESPLAPPIRESLCRAENEQIDLERKLDECAKSLALDTIDENSLITADDSLDREEDRLRLWNRLSEDLARAQGLNEQRTDRANQCREAVDDTRKELEATKRGWRQWLTDRGLRETFSPDAVFELQSKIELGHTQLRQVRGTQRRVDTIQTGIDDYAAAVQPLASTFDIEFDGDDPRLSAAAADALADLRDQVEQKVRNRTEVETALKNAIRRLEKREHGLRSARLEIERLLDSGGAKDAEDFRKRAEIHSQRRDLELKQREAIGRLQRISGPGERLESLKDELRDTDIQEIGEEVRRAKEEREAVDKKIGELNFDRGSIRNDLENLVSEEESSKLRAERHRLSERMRGHAREWTVRVIAEYLLREAQSKFERERQPDVVRHAAEFFRNITGDRYETVFSPLGKSEIQVTESKGGPKQPDQLSRGTREQLFLSLRFGLIRELGQRSERLPVIVDEALVNFDPSRGMRAASAFIDLSQTNQVIVFTCHPQIVEWFVSAADELGTPTPSVINIE